MIDRKRIRRSPHFKMSNLENELSPDEENRWEKTKGTIGKGAELCKRHAIPINAIVTGVIIVGLIVGGIIIANAIKGVTEVATDMGEEVVKGIDMVEKYAGDLADGVESVAKKLWNETQIVVSKIAQGLEKLGQEVEQEIKADIQALKNDLATVEQEVKADIQTLKNDITTVENSVAGILKKIEDWF
jgi:gas vesicle protein